MSTNRPLVSILLPTLNVACFLPARLKSIFDQTISDWELIAADSYSIDGSWEMLTAAADKDQRILCQQVPRGLYQAWNFCLEQACGKYIYVATGDDTMRPDCLAVMTAALEEYPECDICDSLLQLIDTEGHEIDAEHKAYPHHHWHYNFPRDVKHIRRAPHDYYLHLCGKTVYTSLTQILIRSSLFSRTGPFPTTFGPEGDYYWGLQASLTADVIFIPEKIATWRIHERQATNKELTEEYLGNYYRILDAIKQSLSTLKDVVISQKAHQLIRLMVFKGELLSVKACNNWFFSSIIGIKTAICYPLIIFEYLYCLALSSQQRRGSRFGRAYDLMIQRWIRRQGIASYIEVIERESLAPR